MEILSAISTATGTIWKRTVKGPKLPGWTFQYELTVELLRDLLSKGDPSVSRVHEIRSKTKSRPPIDGTKTKEFAIEGMKAEWVVHETSEKSNRVVLYLHGGIYLLMSPETHRPLTSTISKSAQAKVLAIDYRLAPENPFPAAVEDAVKAYNWLVSAEDGPKIPPSQIAIMGDSAGGGLTFATLLKLKELGIQLPAAACGMSPWVDLSGEVSAKSLHENKDYDLFGSFDHDHKTQLMYVQTKENLKNPLASPYYGDVTGFPPTLIQVGQAEMIRDEGVAFAEKLKAAGSEVKLEIYPNMIHVFQMFITIPETISAFNSIGEFFKQKIPDAIPEAIAN